MKLLKVSRLVTLAAIIAVTTSVAAQEETENSGRTPPRLSFVDGEVSFWRPGAADWSPAQVNTPLGAGDQLYAGGKANLEVQIGARAFVRAGEDTQLGISNLEPDFLQLRVVSGHVSLDLRTVKSGRRSRSTRRTAAFTIEHAGYYRVEVGDQNDELHDPPRRPARRDPGERRARRGRVERAGVVSGAETRRQLASYAAPELDDWDRWNYTRTDQQLRRGELALRAARRVRRRRPRPLRRLARGADVRLRVGAARRPRAGRRTAPGAGSGIRTTAGPGSTTRRGAGRRTTTAAGC